MSDQSSDPSRPFDPPVPPTAPPAPPQAPPAPPAAPEPPRPEVPKYGEYAPVDETNPYGVPGYPAAASEPAASAHAAPATGAPTSAAPGYAPPVRTRRTWDVVLTSIVLVLGLVGMSLGLLYAWAFSNPEILRGALAKQGLTGDLKPGVAPAVIAISHIVLYLLALGLSIPLMIRGRVVVFWIPLVIGVVAAIIFWVSLGIVIASDSTLLNSYVTGS
ncbi:MAG TPA: DUF6264 family protein [Pseudolysinimonas sp.]|nr:DUF6264 family protein [Pseudolysinimonas sp.]